MLTNTLRAMVNNLFFKNFYEKRKKKSVLIAFSISLKSGVKTFLNELLTITLRAPVNITFFYIQIFKLNYFAEY